MKENKKFSECVIALGRSALEGKADRRGRRRYGNVEVAVGFPSIADLRAYSEMYCFRYFMLGEYVECWFAPSSFVDMHAMIGVFVAFHRFERPAALYLFSDNGYLLLETY